MTDLENKAFEELRAKVKYLNTQIPKWIPASQPPKHDGCVIVWCPEFADEAIKGYYLEQDEAWFSNIGTRLHGTTHWMSLPPEPEQEESEQ